MMIEVAMVAGGAGLATWAVQDANKHKAVTPLWDRLVASLVGAAGVMLLVAVPLAKMPVVTDIQATIVERLPGSVSVRIVGTKPVGRKDCIYLRTDSFVTTAFAAQLEVPRTVEEDPFLGNTRPPGRHDFGIWTVTFPIGTHPAEVSFYALHNCAWWMPPTTTRIGPVPLP